MPIQTFTLEGLHELVDSLMELPKATSTNVQKRTLMRAGDLIREDAEASAPVRTGKLQQSFSVGTKLSRRQKFLNKRESKVEVFAGPGALVQAITSEFGTAHQNARPFMRPAWDANKRPALDGIKEDLSKEILKAAQRLARKQAKLLAKT